MEPEARRSPYFVHSPGSGFAHRPPDVPPQPILQSSIRTEQDGASVIPRGPRFVHQPLNGPILQQPVTQDGRRGPPRTCPPGLEYLSMVNQLLVHQKADYWEGSGFEHANKYKIRNNLGQDVYFAKEHLIRDCCGHLNPSALDLSIFDNSRNQVMHLCTPLADECCSPSAQDLEVSAPPGNLLGTVHRESGFWEKNFAVQNAQGDIVLRIKGPSAFEGSNEFRITTPDGSSNIGRISKQWSGFLREVFSDADDFNINFPVDLDVKTKAILLGALFFIDILFYESRRNH